MTPTQRKLRTEALKVSMANLVRNQHFADFVDLLRERENEAVAALCLEGTLKNERLSMAVVGEIRTYRDIIAIYDEFLSQPLPSESE
jgi:hypothetical protein